MAAINNASVDPGSITELAKDMFMLSFYLCGMNAVDLYAANYEIKNGRIEYYRSKTNKKEGQCLYQPKIDSSGGRFVATPQGSWQTL